MKKTLFVIVILAIILGTFYFLNKKEAIAPAVVPDDTSGALTDIKSGEFCFAKFGVPDKNGSYDRYTLRLILNDGKATGELNLLPAETDSKTGEFEGVVGAVNEAMERTADLWWFTFAEGMSAKEELKIILSENTASIGFGEMVDRGDGVYIYKDSKNISYTLELASMPCVDLNERANVESYLHENIVELSPAKAVLGGTWYVVSDTIDLAKNSGTVTYEDGHIQEKRNFSYTTNDKGEVLDLKIK